MAISVRNGNQTTGVTNTAAVHNGPTEALQQALLAVPVEVEQQEEQQQHAMTRPCQQVINGMTMVVPHTIVNGTRRALTAKTTGMAMRTSWMVAQRTKLAVPVEVVINKVGPQTIFYV